MLNSAPYSRVTHCAPAVKSPSLEKLKEKSADQASLNSNTSKKKLTAGEPQPFPTHIQVASFGIFIQLQNLNT